MVDREAWNARLEEPPGDRVLRGDDAEPPGQASLLGREPRDRSEALAQMADAPAVARVDAQASQVTELLAAAVHVHGHDRRGVHADHATLFLRDDRPFLSAEVVAGEER